MKITDRDIVDFQMGDASPELERRIRRSAQRDPSTAERLAQWSAILTAIEDERKTHKALQQRAIDGVMSRIAEEKAHQAKQLLSVPRRGARRSFSPSWTLVCGAVATACIVLGIAYLSLKPASLEDRSDQAAAQVAPTTESTGNGGQFESPVLSPLRPQLATFYVEFKSNGPGDGSAGNPYTTLAEGVAALRPGETLSILAGASNERLRIDKPIRLLAVGGSVRIGPTG